MTCQLVQTLDPLTHHRYNRRGWVLPGQQIAITIVATANASSGKRLFLWGANPLAVGDMVHFANPTGYNGMDGLTGRVIESDASSVVVDIVATYGTFIGAHAQPAYRMGQIYRDPPMSEIYALAHEQGSFGLKSGSLSHINSVYRVSHDHRGTSVFFEGREIHLPETARIIDGPLAYLWVIGAAYCAQTSSINVVCMLGYRAAAFLSYDTCAETWAEHWTTPFFQDLSPSGQYDAFVYLPLVEAVFRADGAEAVLAGGPISDGQVVGVESQACGYLVMTSAGYTLNYYGGVLVNGSVATSESSTSIVKTDTVDVRRRGLIAAGYEGSAIVFATYDEVTTGEQIYRCGKNEYGPEFFVSLNFDVTTTLTVDLGGSPLVLSGSYTASAIGTGPETESRTANWSWTRDNARFIAHHIHVGDPDGQFYSLHRGNDPRVSHWGGLTKSYTETDRAQDAGSGVPPSTLLSGQACHVFGDVSLTTSFAEVKFLPVKGSIGRDDLGQYACLIAPPSDGWFDAYLWGDPNNTSRAVDSAERVFWAKDMTEAEYLSLIDAASLDDYPAHALCVRSMV